MTVKTRHFVTFYSPGTFTSESTTKEIPEPHPPLAARLAREVEERHGAKPYGFRFETRITHDPIPDGIGGTLRVESKMIAKTGTYYLTGTVRAYSEIPQTKETSILRSNMRCNDWPLVVENTNSYRAMLPYGAEDRIVDADGNVTDEGGSLARETQRTTERAAWATPDES